MTRKPMKFRNVNWKCIAWFPCLVLLAFMLSACDEGALVESNTANPSESEPSEAYAVDGKATEAGQEVNQDLKMLSRVIARALADETMRQKFHEHAMKKFDGETNVLWMDLKSEVKQSVLAAAQAGKASATMQAMERSVSRASEALGGNLHLYWAFAENFDGSRAPWVTFTPVHIDADNVTELTAYDARGQEHRVDEEIAHKRPVVVLNRNERTNKKGEVYPSYICPPGDPIGNCEPPPPPPPPPPDDDGGNEYAGYMRLDWIRMYDAYEGWPNGGPEFHATFTRYNAATEQTGKKLTLRLEDEFNIDRGDCDGRKIYLNKELFYWNAEDYPTYSIQWLESDGDDFLYKYWIEDVPFVLPAWAEATHAIVSYFINRDAKDDMLEHAATDASDPNPKYYGTGAPDFQLTRIPEDDV